LKLKQAITECKPKAEVSDLFDKYEACYKKLHNPSERHKQDYVALYFVYSEYMARREK